MLVAYAEEEIRRAGLFDADADYDGQLGASIMRVVRAFAAEQHSGGSAFLTLAVLEKVLRYQPLTPLTRDPAEWQHVGEFMDGRDVWQSRRQPGAFSTDGGRTYYDLDERKAWWLCAWSRLNQRLGRGARYRTHVAVGLGQPDGHTAA